MQCADPLSKSGVHQTIITVGQARGFTWQIITWIWINLSCQNQDRIQTQQYASFSPSFQIQLRHQSTQKTHFRRSGQPLARVYDELQIGYKLRASCVATLHLKCSPDELPINFLFMEPLSHLGEGEQERFLCSPNGIVLGPSQAQDPPISNI